MTSNREHASPRSPRASSAPSPPGAPGVPTFREHAWGWAPAVLTTVIAAILSTIVFARIPHVQDSIAQLFQARIFAGGHLTAPAPDLKEFFEYHHMILSERWYSQYPPGHPLLLVPGVWLGLPWLVNPVLGGLSIFGVYLLGRELFEDVRVARVAVLLGAVSPFVLLMSSEFMSHAGGFFALTWFFYFYARMLRTGRAVDGLLAGLFLALGILVRPYSAFGFALPIMGHAAWTIAKGMRRVGGGAPGNESGSESGSSPMSSPARSVRPVRPGRSARPAWRAWAALVGAAALGILALALYNAGTTGSPTRFGYTELYGPSHGVGFGKGSWGPPHTLARGLSGFGDSIASLSRRLFEWPGPSAGLGLSIVPLLLGIGWRGRDWRRRVWLASVPASLLFVYVFYWFRDDCFGPRYLYEGMGPILLLSSAGLWLLVDRVTAGTAKSKRIRRRSGGIAMASILGLLTLLSVTTKWPRLFEVPDYARSQPQDSPIRWAAYFQYFGPQFWAVGPRLGDLVASEVEPPAVVFTRFKEPFIDEEMVRWIRFGSAFARMDPYLDDSDVIYARDLGEHNSALAARYPDRNLYLYEGTVRDGRLIRVR